MTTVLETEVYVVIKGHVDLSKEIEKLAGKRAALQQSVANIKAEMGAPGYSSVPEGVRAGREAKLASNITEIASLDAAIAAFEAIAK